jgi:hypothetical protein
MVDADVTQQFIDTLAALERERNAERITYLFGPESEVGNIVSPDNSPERREHARFGRRTGTPSER